MVPTVLGALAGLQDEVSKGKEAQELGLTPFSVRREAIARDCAGGCEQSQRFSFGSLKWKAREAKAAGGGRRQRVLGY